jgi:uncharacterized membrane protein YfcA
VGFIFEYTGLGLSQLIYASIVLLVAGFVRGYSGFGFSALAVTGLSLFLLPKKIIPVILCLEVCASIHMLPKVWHKINWQLIAYLAVGAACATPFGIWILATLPEKPMRITLFLLVLGLSLVLLAGVKIANAQKGITQFSVGSVSGLFNGIAALGGLPVVLFLIAVGAEAVFLRATTVAYFLIIDTVALGSAYSHQLLNMEVLWRVMLFILPVAFGVQLGSRHFFKANPDSFKKFTLALLIGLSLSGLVKTALF